MCSCTKMNLQGLGRQSIWGCKANRQGLYHYRLFKCNSYFEYYFLRV